MIAHLFRIVWNRRRANALVFVELLLSFLVLAGVLTAAASVFRNWWRPLGFSCEGVWRVDLPELAPRASVPRQGERRASWDTFARIRLALRDMPEVEAASPLPVNVPFSNSLMGYTNFVNGRQEFIYRSEVLPEIREVLRLEVRAGRWLEPGDEGLNWRPVVITKRYAETLFGREDPIGKAIPVRTRRDGTPQDGKAEREPRVVGVLGDYRVRGDLHPPALAEFSLLEPGREGWPPENWLVRLRPGLGAEFEERLTRAIRQATPGFTVNVTPLKTERKRAIREMIAPLLVFGTVAVFLVVMVGLGLVGVLWQAVARRTEEWGLRRALGATPGEVRRQVLGETGALATVAIGGGTILFVQLPLVGALGDIPTGIWALGLGVAAVLVYLLVAVCGLYPSWLATRVRPAEALQHE